MRPERLVQRDIPLGQARQAQAGQEAVAQQRTEWAINAAGQLRDTQGALVDQVGGDAEAGKVEQTRAAAQHGAAAFAHTPRGAPARREIRIRYRPQRPMLVKHRSRRRVQEIGGVLRHRRGIELPPQTGVHCHVGAQLPFIMNIGIVLSGPSEHSGEVCC